MMCTMGCCNDEHKFYKLNDSHKNVSNYISSLSLNGGLNWVRGEPRIKWILKSSDEKDGKNKILPNFFKPIIISSKHSSNDMESLLVKKWHMIVTVIKFER